MYNSAGVEEEGGNKFSVYGHHSKAYKMTGRRREASSL